MQCCARNLAQPAGLEVGPNLLATWKVSEQQWRNFSILCDSGLFPGLRVADAESYAPLLADGAADDTALSELERMLLCILLRDDLVTEAVQDYIRAVLGPQFVNTEAPQLLDVCANSVATIPTLILLSADSDPSNQLVQLAETSGLVPAAVAQKCRFVSLGRGQGPNARRQIDEAVQAGGWVVLGNSHLAGAWLQQLESIIEAIGMEQYEVGDKPVQISDSFRIFLTTMPFDGFPSSIIRAATKVSAEAPMGVKNNFIRMVQQLDDGDLALVTDDAYDKLGNEQQQVAVQVQQTYRKYLWNLALYFATVLERRRFGPIGFSTNYDWADPDYVISKLQLNTQFSALLGNNSHVIQTKLNNTISSLRFLISDINVGGRVSDFKDQLIVQSLINAYYQEDLTKLGAEINAKYQIPAHLLINSNKEDYLNYIKQSIPDNDLPELFGLDKVSLLISSGQKGRSLLQTILKSTSTGSAAKENQDLSQEIARIDEISSGLPEVFDLVKVNEKYPTDYYQCMNTVLTQEV